MTDSALSQSRPPALEIFVDGPNFMLSRREGGVPFMLDLNVFATRLSRGYHFVKLRYYTSPLPNVHSRAYRDQQKFFEEMRRSRRLELVLGRHEPRTDRYGERYHVEKETDVNLAVDMVVGAYEERFDVAMLVAGDTHYVRAVRAVQARGKRVVWCTSPPRSTPTSWRSSATTAASWMRSSCAPAPSPGAAERRMPCIDVRGLDVWRAGVTLNLQRAASAAGRTREMSGAVMDISIDQLRSLPLEKRLELIAKLWESLGEDAYEHFPIPDEVVEEAERRYQEHLADPSSSIPWEVARARLRERYG